MTILTTWMNNAMDTEIRRLNEQALMKQQMQQPAYQQKVLTWSPPAYVSAVESEAIPEPVTSWEYVTPTVPSAGSYTVSNGVPSCTGPCCYGPEPGREAKVAERPMTDAEVLEAFRQTVARFGEDWVSDSSSAQESAYNRVFCIQGEMLRTLGLRATAGAVDGVIETLGHRIDVHLPVGRQPRLYRALLRAQEMNDDHQPWGKILRQLDHTLAA